MSPLASYGPTKTVIGNLEIDSGYLSFKSVRLFCWDSWYSKKLIYCFDLNEMFKPMFWNTSHWIFKNFSKTTILDHCVTSELVLVIFPTEMQNTSDLEKFTIGVGIPRDNCFLVRKSIFRVLSKFSAYFRKPKWTNQVTMGSKYLWSWIQTTKYYYLWYAFSQYVHIKKISGRYN